MTESIQVGDTVNYHLLAGGDINSTGHKVKYIELTPNPFGTDVAWITGKSGCVSLQHLSKSEQTND